MKMRLDKKFSSMYYPLSLIRANRKLVKAKYIRSFKRDRKIPELHNILIEITKNAHMHKKYNEKANEVVVLKLLDKIIPMYYFGCTGNRKILYAIVKKILTQSTYECVYTKALIRCYDYEKVMWLSGVKDDPKLCRTYALLANIWLLDYIIKPLINHFYKSVKIGQTYETKFIIRHKWKKFESKVFEQLLSSNHITFDTKCEKIQDSLNRGKIANRLGLGILRILPKTDCDNYEYRPLVIRKIDKNVKDRMKVLSKIINREGRRLSISKTINLYECWKDFVKNVRGRACYGIKIDIKDAFGNVNIDLLCTIIDQISDQQLTENDKRFIKTHIRFKYIVHRRHKGKPVVWKWNHGLLQGDTMSSCLCELYMSYLESLHLQEFCNGNCFIFRYVDDYFFCSTEENLVTRFLSKISIHRLNTLKVQCGLEYINFFGKIFNLTTMEVKGSYQYKENTAFRHRFKFWNIYQPIPWSNPEKFLSQAMLFKYNKFHFDNLELNTTFNMEDTVLENFFNAMIYTAFKFDAAVMAVYDMQRKLTFIAPELRKAIICYSLRAESIIDQMKGQYFYGKIKREMLIFIAYKAFNVVLKKRNAIYNEALEKVNENFNKKINKSGWNRIKHFKTLPECFNQVQMKRMP